MSQIPTDNQVDLYVKKVVDYFKDINLKSTTAMVYTHFNLPRKNILELDGMTENAFKKYKDEVK